MFLYKNVHHRSSWQKMANTVYHIALQITSLESQYKKILYPVMYEKQVYKCEYFVK